MKRRIAKKIEKGMRFQKKKLLKFNDDWDAYMDWRGGRWNQAVLARVKRTLHPDSRHVKPINQDELLEYAHKLAGNHERFDCFVWYRDSEVDNPSNWGIVYTHNRDSRLLEESNASVITRRMSWFTNGDDPDVVFEDHNHWACGWIKGFSVRVFRDGKVTRAVRRYFRMKQAMEDYPILDESDHSEKELYATYENIKDAMWKVKNEFVMPDDEDVWQQDIYQWLADNEDQELEDKDDQGGYPSEESLRRACEALGYESELELV